MIIQNGFKIYQSEELSNDEYHGEDFKEYISGSNIATVLERSVQHLFFGERKESPALAFGTAVHTAVLEPYLFDKEYIQAIDKEDYPDALGSDAVMKSWLKARGISGYSSKKTNELIEMVKKTGEDIQIWPEIKAEFDAKTEGKEQLKKDVFEKIRKMSAAVQHKYPICFADMNPEVSLIGEIDGHDVKVRIDMITVINGETWIIDYKTCQNAVPEKFGRDAHSLHYYEKMALQKECFKKAYGYEPAGVALLAQEKEAPFVSQLYVMTEDQLNIGWDNCQTAIKLIENAVENEEYPAYGEEFQDLFTPHYVLSRYEDDLMEAIV